MSPAKRYAKPQITTLNGDTWKQVQAAGQVLASNGVKHDNALGQIAPAPTPAQKFGHPGSNAVLKSQQVQGERTHALTPDSNLGQHKPPTQGRSL
jgi:hypothetical protein